MRIIGVLLVAGLVAAVAIGITVTGGDDDGATATTSVADGLDPGGGADGPVLYSANGGSGGRELALVLGVLELEGDCLYQRDEFSGIRRPVMWPFGTRWRADPPAVITLAGRALLVGGPINEAGGYHPMETLTRFTTAPAALDGATACLATTNATEVAVVQ